MSGKAAPKKALLKQLLHSDFDPAAWDDHMAAAFGDDYYAEVEREADVRADAADLARDLASWAPAGADAAAAAREGTFEALHTRVTGAAPTELLETDYDVAQPAHVDADESSSDGEDGSGSDGGSAGSTSSSEADSDSSQDGSDDGARDERGDGNEHAQVAEKKRTKEQVCLPASAGALTLCDVQQSCLGSVATALT